MTKNKQLEVFKEFLRIPSISIPKYSSEIVKAQDFLVKLFQNMNFETKILKSQFFDAVFAQKIINKNNPTILVYGHYDVQPPEPLDQWKTKPFDPQVKNGKIFARGATDDKGQILAHILAAEKLISDLKENCPVNIKFIIEGEEEVGSPSVEKIAQKYSDTLLKCDYIILSDNEMVSKDQPSIDISFRGIIYTEIFLKTGEHDVHSGQFGGLTENSAIILSKVIAKLKDDKGNILIPEFYDDVKDFPKEVIKEFKKIKVSENSLKEEGKFFVVGGGEAKFSLNERRWTRPTLDVNGLTSGVQGDGQKTIIPNEASAKISMRLVANQDPEKIFNLYSKYVKKLVPKGIEIKVKNYCSSSAYQAPTKDNIFNLGKASLKQSFGKKAIFAGMGGTIGFVPILVNKLNVPCLMIGFALPTDNLHAPNEHFLLRNFYKAIETMVIFYKKLGNTK